MLNRRLRVLGTAACAVVIFTMSAWAEEPDGAGAGATAVEVSELANDGTVPFLEPLVPIPAATKIHRVNVTPGPEGNSVEFTGSVSDAGTSIMDCNNAPDSLYCNTAGTFLMGFGGDSATGRWSDDIVTTASSGLQNPDACLIDRYVIRVTGDRLQDDSGVALGGYRVDYALYETCPAASLPRVIPGTAGFMDVDAANAGEILEIVHNVPGPTNAKLPSVAVYLGIKFSRDKCGVVAGAQALKGYSAKTADLPGQLCSGGIGPNDHASFYAEIYARGECAELHVGYRNSDHGESPNSAGANRRLADDIVLPENCLLVAYEVAFKDALIEVDLRTNPLSGEDGPFIPGTRKQFLNFLGFGVQVGHVDVDPPVQLFGGTTYWLAAKSSSGTNGVVQTCRAPQIGESADLHQVFDQNIWKVEAGDANCFGGFDVTLYCAGAPAPGACCDVVRGECLGGTGDGKACKINAQCGGGTCESACRDVPRINCTADSNGTPSLWQEGDTCGPVCTAGGALGKACSNEADCTACSGGTRDGELCCEGGTCGPPVCQQRPEITCSSDTDCRVCDGGGNDGQPCTVAADCPDGICDPAASCGMVPTCVGGTRPGEECCPGGFCPLGICDGAFCEGGANNGAPCTREVDCPGGSCEGGPFARPCGMGACCKPSDPDEIGICENLTKNECNALVGGQRLFQVGRRCGGEGQSCPLSACISRSGSCTAEDPTFCVGGQFDGRFCDFLAFPSDCATDFSVENYCGGNCVGGTRAGQLCDPNGFFAPSCDGANCQDCPPPDCPEHCADQCPNGFCQPAFCRGNVGCSDIFCCTDVCQQSNFFFCCDVHWTEQCANQALDVCPRVVVTNDECFGVIDGQNVKALEMRIPDTFQADSISATPDVAGSGSGPGFCCHNENPGGRGVGSVWYKFIAVDTSVRISTCNTDTKVVDGNEYRGEDSLISVYSVLDPSRGICADQSPCDLLVPDCADGSECKFDEEFACGNLSPLACNDNSSSCGDNPNRSNLCVTGLVPGQPYYVQIAGKSNDIEPPPDPNNPPPRPIIRGNGAWRVTVSSPCTNPLPQMLNDACADAEEVVGGDVAPVATQFDLSGTILGQCEGGTTPGVQCVVANGNCAGNGICRKQAPATFDCPGPPVSCLFNTMSNDIWYEWIAPATGEGLVDACGDPNELTPDTGMVAYDGCQCPADDRLILGCSWLESSPCLGGSKVRFPVTEGSCYQIRLGGHQGGEPEGELVFSVGDFCGNGRSDSNRCVGGANVNLACVEDADCPDGMCGEECDGGTGCLSDCSCGEGYERPFFPGPSCRPTCGDGLVVEGEQCDGGLECGAFCTCSFNSQPTTPPSIDCEPLPNCGDGVIDFGEECDSGLGCTAFCTCNDGFDPDSPPALDCLPGCGPATPGKPACDGVLPRTAGTVIKLQYPADIAVCNPTIQIRELLDGGLYNADLSGSFSIVDAGGGLMILTDSGATLVNRMWYGITDNLGTKIDYIVIYGNVDGDQDTDALDANAIWQNRLNPVSDNTPFDIDGDGDVDALDVNAAWFARDALVPPVPPKPTGHACP